MDSNRTVDFAPQLCYTYIVTMQTVAKKAGEIMTLEEQRQAVILTYVNLMRIKACETSENKELDYQIKVAKVMLQNFGIDFSELEY